MKTLRRSLRISMSAALLALLLVLAAGPVAAARCEVRGYCPMMASAARTVACRDLAGGMSAPMDCCRPIAAPSPAAPMPGLSSPPALQLAIFAGAALADESSRPAAFSRAGTLHPLGLFTLHSVWRI